VNPWIFPSSVAAPCSSSRWYGINCSAVLVEDYDLNFTVADVGVPLSCSITALALMNASLYGTLPATLADLSYVEVLDLSRNSLYGSIPSTLGDISGLLHFGVALNCLSGTLPWQLFGSDGVNGTTSLESLDVSSNLLTGTLPSTVSWSSSLVAFSTGYNPLSGPLPTVSLETASEMAFFLVFNTFVSQSIPSEIGTLSKLEFLYLYVNLLTGTVTSAFWVPSKLAILFLDENILTSSIPASVGLALSLNEVSFFNNLISGSIPSELGNVTTLTSLEMNNMMLSGTVPVELGTLPLLQNLLLYDNCLTGPLPPVFSPASTGINFNGNSLSGTLPDSLGLLARMDYFAVDSNFITGPIPSTLGLLKNMSLISLYGIFLTGTLPSQLGEMRSLTCIEVNINYLTGTVPTELGGMVSLQFAQWGANFLSSTIPETFRQATSLEFLDMSGNILSGSLTTVFADMKSFPALSSIDLSQNSLTGVLPATLFNSSALAFLTLYTNCFSGSLPEEICLATNLSIVILDALSTAAGCSQSLSRPIASFIKGVFPERIMTGSIPPCLFSLPRLSTLHLSGNGFIGSLPADDEVIMSPLFQGLVLASNNLVGSIPENIQAHPGWVSLDLSSNRLSGTLLPSVAVNATGTALALSVNRLSGKIPGIVLGAASVNILEGNLFACTTETEPSSDPDHGQYVCGSTNLNTALAVWVGCAGALLVSMFIYKMQRSSTNLLFVVSSSALEEQLQNAAGSVRHFFRLLAVFHTCVVCLAGAFITIGLLAFPLMKSTSLSSLYSTHTVQFTWVTSTAYTHGIFPAVLMIVMLFASVTFVCILFVGRARRYKVGAEDVQQGLPVYTWEAAFRRRGIIITAQLVQMVISLTVNFAYIHAVVEGLHPNQLRLVQTGLSLYKAVDSLFLTPRITAWLPFHSVSHKVQYMTFMSLFSMVLVPTIATLLSDASCLRYAVTGQAQITSSFEQSVYVCTVTCLADLGCKTSCSLSTAYSATTVTSVAPPWLYGYQCSSALLTNYAPVLFLYLALTGIVIPCLTWFGANYAQSIVEADGNSGQQQSKHWWVFDVLLRHTKGTIYVEPEEAGAKLRTVVLNAPAIISRRLVSLALLLTFGLSVPLVSLAVAFDSAINMLLWRWLSGRYLVLADSKDKRRVGDDQETHGMWLRVADEKLQMATSSMADAPLGLNVGLVSIFAVLFWCLFIFDAVGDVYGSSAGGLVLLVPTLGLLLLFVSLNLRLNNTSFIPRALSVLGVLDTRATDFELPNLETPVLNPTLPSDFAI
jgi:Leucine-rich repeat (LRR) protein